MLLRLALCLWVRCVLITLVRISYLGNGLAHNLDGTLQERLWAFPESHFPGGFRSCQNDNVNYHNYQVSFSSQKQASIYKCFYAIFTLGNYYSFLFFLFYIY